MVEGHVRALGTLWYQVLFNHVPTSSLSSWKIWCCIASFVVYQSLCMENPSSILWIYSVLVRLSIRTPGTQIHITQVLTLYLKRSWYVYQAGSTYLYHGFMHTQSRTPWRGRSFLPNLWVWRTTTTLNAGSSQEAPSQVLIHYSYY